MKAGLGLAYVSGLTACRKLVGTFKHSYKAEASLEDMHKKLEIPTLKLIQDVSTRWNSTNEMIVRIIEQKTSMLLFLLAKCQTGNLHLAMAK